jgi:hypothetical protein
MVWKDIYIVDEEFTGKGAELDRHRKFFADCIDRYVNITSYLCSHISGQTADTIKGISEALKPMASRLRSLGSDYRSQASNFISAVDVADTFLY